MNSKIFWFLFVLLSLPSISGAWGLATHLYQGGLILLNPQLIAASLHDILLVYSIDFLYGMICADFFVGKGSKQKTDHCHNWDMGNRILATSTTQRQQSFAWGYLAHLGADTIAHNYFVPSLQETPGFLPQKMSHMYWEVIADSEIPDKLWRHLQTVIYHHHDEHDQLLNDVMKTDSSLFKLKRFVYRKSVELHNLKVWQNQVLKVKRKYSADLIRVIKYFQRISFYCAVDILCKYRDSKVYKYDPVGTYNMFSGSEQDIKLPDELIDLENMYSNKLNYTIQ